jgi:hypothetical protein
MIQGKHVYYLDFPDFGKKHPSKVVIKLLRDHPDFSEDWVQEGDWYDDEPADKVFTRDDFEIKHETISMQVFIDDKIPPPPPDKENRQS